MPLWSKKHFVPKAVSEPVPFQLACRCGQTVSGLRTSVHQRIHCKCGEPYFVLPIDVYPKPKLKKPKTPLNPIRTNPKPQPTERRSDQDATIRLSRNETVPEKKEPVPQKKVEKSAKKTKTPITAESDRPQPVRKSRFMTPFRSIMVGIVCAIAATGYWAYHSQAVENAESIVWKAAENGQMAFQDGDFAGALEHLSVAVEALDLIGREDVRTRGIRQFERQAYAASHLSNSDLLEITSQGKKTTQAKDAGHWQYEFRDSHAGKWIVLQTSITKYVDDDGLVDYTLFFPLSSETRPIILMFGPSQSIFKQDFDLFEELTFEESRSANGTDTNDDIGQTSETQEIFIAVELVDCRLDESLDPSSWVIELNSENVFLWTDYDSLIRLGFKPDLLHDENQLRTMLSQQAIIMQVPPTTPTTATDKNNPNE